MNLLPGFVIGIEARCFGNLLLLYVGTSILRCEIIFFLIFKLFLADLSIIDANPICFALAFFIGFQA